MLIRTPRSIAAHATGVGAVKIPTALGWPLATYPLVIRKAGSGYVCDVAPRSFVPAPFGVAATVYWVDVTAGSNSNSGLSAAAPKKSINAAITAGNLTGGPYLINVKGGHYGRPDNCNGSSGTVMTTQDCAIIGYGGRVTNSSHGDLTYTLNDAPTGTYQVSRSTVGRVIDLSSVDSFGNYAELTMVADLATCKSTAGSWALVAGTLYVHRADGAAPTNTNTRVLLDTNAGYFDATTKSVYVEGVDFMGGAQGAFAAVGGGTRNVVAVDCSFKYSGASADLVDGVRIGNFSGIALFQRCVAAANAKDGFNFTATGGEGLYPLTIDCEGYDNGRFSSTSNNGWTSHNAVINIDVSGYYHATRNGSDFHHINSSRALACGTRVASTDTVESSSTRAAIKGSNTAVTWLHGCSVSGLAMAIYAQGGTIHKRDVIVSAGIEVADSGGSIDEYPSNATAWS